MGWEWCFRENSTYLDCPVSEYEDDTNMMVAVFNPATNGPTDYISFPLKHGHYSVSVFNRTQSSFQALDSSSAAVICENETLENGFSLKTCQIYVAYAVDSLQVGLI
jgi:hypothetical protein